MRGNLFDISPLSLEEILAVDGRSVLIGWSPLFG